MCLALFTSASPVYTKVRRASIASLLTSGSSKRRVFASFQSTPLKRGRTVSGRRESGRKKTGDTDPHAASPQSSASGRPQCESARGWRLGPRPPRQQSRCTSLGRACRRCPRHGKTRSVPGMRAEGVGIFVPEAEKDEKKGKRRWQQNTFFGYEEEEDDDEKEPEGGGGTRGTDSTTGIALLIFRLLSKLLDQSATSTQNKSCESSLFTPPPPSPPASPAAPPPPSPRPPPTAHPCGPGCSPGRCPRTGAAAPPVRACALAPRSTAGGWRRG